MTDLLSIGRSALLANTAALNTTSNNIANANTEGYTRQRVNLVSSLTTSTGVGYIGTGVNVSSVDRVMDTLLTTRLLSSNSATQRLGVMSTYADRVDTLLSDSTTGVSSALDSFFDAANTLAQDPTSDVARASLLSAAESLSTTFGTLQDELAQMSTEVAKATTATVDEINDYTRQIADLNEAIVEAQASSGGDQPNDLLDQRDQLLNKLSGLVGISTVSQDDGSVNVFIASGQSLVLGNRSTDLGVADDSYGSGAVEITYGGGSISNQISGGELGGLLDTQRQVIEPAMNSLGELAAGLVEAVNTQHAQGVDANGNLGGDFFEPMLSSGLPATSNSGSAGVAVQIGSAADLSGEDYVLRYNGSSWSMTERSTGSLVTLTGSGTEADPFVADGLEIVVSGSAAAGDSYLLQPTASLAGNLSVALTDTDQLAAASALEVSSDLGNSGTATGLVQVTDAANPQLLDAATISFTSANTYQINGSGSYAYAAGDSINVNGWSLTLEGNVAAGDSFTVAAASADSSDNTNALALAGIGSSKILNGGSQSVLQAATSLVAQAGQRASSTAISLDAQTTINNQIVAQRESVSGVNLDEEAANLLRYQQAYQAAAQMIQTANEMFRTLLNAVGG